jgi:hypothetical protein
MKSHKIRSLGILACLTLVFTGGSRGEDAAPPDFQLPLPLYHSRPDSGFFIGGSYIMYRQTNTMGNETLAVRGFIDATGAATASAANPAGFPGSFQGSGVEALNTNQVSGPSSYSPGFKLEAGWKFEDSSSLTVDFMWLAPTNYTSGASFVPKNLQFGSNLANSYLYSPVYNFPNNYAGPLDDVRNISGQVDNPPTESSPGPGLAYGTAYGIWNGAELMTLKFSQKFQQLEATYRKPVYETENYRCSAVVGPRAVWFWERFAWVTTDTNIQGDTGNYDSALYTNIVSNRMYGLFGGAQQEWYWGHGFAGFLDTRAALMVDIVNTRAKYEFTTKNQTPVSKRSRKQYTLVPELQANLGINYYPFEGVEIRLGYDVMAFFNTISSPVPVSFDWMGVDPGYQSTFRLLDGFNAGFALVF